LTCYLLLVFSIRQLVAEQVAKRTPVAPILVAKHAQCSQSVEGFSATACR